MLFQDINKDCGIDRLYKLEFMEMDGTYEHNIAILLTFTFGAELENIWNINKYNGKGPAVTTNALNPCKDLLEACAVAGNLNRE